MKRQVILAGILAVTGLANSALAADLYAKAPPPAAPADWYGFYVGIEGGYGWGRDSLDPTYPFISSGIINTSTGPVTINSIQQNGWLFGGFAGAQRQWGNWVLGIEADYDGADITGSTTGTGGSTGVRHGEVFANSVTADSKIDELGSVRAKVGFPLQNWLFYATGGLAFAHDTYSATATMSCTGFNTRGREICAVPGNNFSVTGSDGNLMLGWALGGGVDWKWMGDAGSSWILGLEYLHYQFPSNTITGANNTIVGPGNIVSVNSAQAVDSLKLRLSYLFGIH